MSKKIETLSVQTIKNLENVYFEPVDSGLYIMEGRMKNGFTIEVGVTEELKQEIEKMIEKGIDNMEIKEVSPRTIQIELPKNVPSKVRPIVIFPTVEAEAVTVKVTEYDSYGSEKEVYTTVDSSISHVINLNTGVE